MPANIERFDIGGGAVTVITDPKFKTNLMSARFLTGYDIEKAAAYALIPQVVTSTNSDFPDVSLFNRRLNALYGAWLGGYTRVRGEIYELGVSASAICDRYALEGESVTLETVKLLINSIFCPNIVDGGFEPVDFGVKKAALLNQIDGEINDKSGYAGIRAYETAFRGETASCRFFGTRERVSELTPKRAYEVYRELLKSARIEITLCGGEDFGAAVGIIKKAFDRRGEIGPLPEFFSPSIPKPEIEYKTEYTEVRQANLVMVFKAPGANRTAMKLLSWLYGETPFSKLFMNVRERLSLCYFCSSSYSETKEALTVVSGVAPENIKTAEREILNQLEAVARGDFSESELNDTKLAMADFNRSVYDNSFRLGEWYHIQRLKGRALSPDDFTAEINALTREDIMAAAKKIRPDTVYVLTEKE